VCGIAGYFSLTRPIARPRLRALRDALAHRGPDDAGEVCWDAQGRRITDPDQPAHFALLHRRLSILDLSPAGHQPMASADGECWIAFNGEIYNFRELRARLESAGHPLRGGSDTEVLLETLRREGFSAALEAAQGMFAFAAFEPCTRTLRLARDRLGKKPLYWMRDREDGTFVFASEVKALRAAGFLAARRLSAQAFDEFWTLGYVARAGSIFEDVQQLPPAMTLECSPEAGCVERGPYWLNPMGVVAPRHRRLDEAADELECRLGEAVKTRLVADVPVGLFLSGGVDSALVAALAARAGARDLRAFTVGFRHPGLDESSQAAAIARHLGLPHEILPVEESHAQDFARIARHFDQPFGDVSCLPTYFLCRAARERVTVALTGDGGDEGFAGYEDYQEGLRLWGPPALRRVLRRNTPTPRQRLQDIYYRLLGPAEGFARKGVHFNAAHKRRFYAPRLEALIRENPGLHARRIAGRVEVSAKMDPVAIGQGMDLHTYLPDDILVKIDRMSMAVGLEARCPLLDHRVIEFAATLPLELRVDAQGRGKRVLRHLLARHVPPALWDRPKSGFTPPWADWYPGLREDLRRRWRDLPSDWIQPGAADYVFPAADDRFRLLTWNFFSWLVFEESWR
jgi:asparagine synthase (glutamine-hydrolysing)